MPTLKVNGLDFYYQEDNFTAPWQTPETLWIQHGFGRHSAFWYHWIPRLAGHFRILRRDMRGHGRSQDPGPDYQFTLEDLLSDMKGFLDAMGLEKVHYVGESVGGTLGIAFAARWPERLKSLTLCAAPTAISPPLEKVMALKYPSMPAAIEALGTGGFARAMNRKNAVFAQGQAQMDWIIREWERTPTHVLVSLARLVTNPKTDVAPLLEQVKVPTLVLAPTRSAFTPLSHQVMLRDRIPGARIAVIDSAAHEIYVDNPDDCTRAILNFINTLPA